MQDFDVNKAFKASLGSIVAFLTSNIAKAIIMFIMIVCFYRCICDINQRMLDGNLILLSSINLFERMTRIEKLGISVFLIQSTTANIEFIT